jgi:multidrug resistance efflux pump
VAQNAQAGAQYNQAVAQAKASKSQLDQSLAQATQAKASVDVAAVNLERTIIRAPIDGVVTERGANVGLNADQATKLFTVVDLSTVWVVANLYEKDFPRVRVGNEAAITTSARPDLARAVASATSIPRLAPTRTAKVRIEVQIQVANSGSISRMSW